MSRSTPCHAAGLARMATLRARVKPLVLGLALACTTGAGRDALALSAHEALPSTRTADFLTGAARRSPRSLVAASKKAGASPSHPSATTWTVTSCEDNGPGSLRDVVDHFAADGDTIDSVRAALMRLFDGFVLHLGMPDKSHVELIGKTWIEPIVREQAIEEAGDSILPKLRREPLEQAANNEYVVLTT